jgi:energy-coupling factor transport system substrate-specific component
MKKTIEEYSKLNIPGLQAGLEVLNRNPELMLHSHKVAYFALSIFDQLQQKFGLTEQERETLFCAAILHDIGKTRIDETVLNKTSRLTEEEFQLLKRHPEEGLRFLSTFACGEEIERQVLHHHERFDGRGYPHGLKQEEIPLLSRIIAIADSFDAMISHRCYKDKLSQDCALGEILENAGSQFDPSLAGIFIQLVETGKVQYGSQLHP